MGEMKVEGPMSSSAVGGGIFSKKKVDSPAEVAKKILENISGDQGNPPVNFRAILGSSIKKPAREGSETTNELAKGIQPKPGKQQESSPEEQVAIQSGLRGPSMEGAPVLDRVLEPEAEDNSLGILDDVLGPSMVGSIEVEKSSGNDATDTLGHGITDRVRSRNEESLILKSPGSISNLEEAVDLGIEGNSLGISGDVFGPSVAGSMEVEKSSGNNATDTLAISKDVLGSFVLESMEVEESPGNDNTETLRNDITGRVHSEADKSLVLNSAELQDINAVFNEGFKVIQGNDLVAQWSFLRSAKACVKKTGNPNVNSVFQDRAKRSIGEIAEVDLFIVRSDGEAVYQGKSLEQMDADYKQILVNPNVAKDVKNWLVMAREQGRIEIVSQRETQRRRDEGKRLGREFERKFSMAWQSIEARHAVIKEKGFEKNEQVRKLTPSTKTTIPESKRKKKSEPPLGGSVEKNLTRKNLEQLEEAVIEGSIEDERLYEEHQSNIRQEHRDVDWREEKSRLQREEQGLATGPLRPEE